MDDKSSDSEEILNEEFDKMGTTFQEKFIEEKKDLI